MNSLRPTAVAVIQNAFDFFRSDSRAWKEKQRSAEGEEETDIQWGQRWGGCWSFYQMRLISWTNHIPTSCSRRVIVSCAAHHSLALHAIQVSCYEMICTTDKQRLTISRRWWKLQILLSEQKRSSFGARVVRHSEESGSSMALNDFSCSVPYLVQMFSTCWNLQPCHYKLIIHPGDSVKGISLWFNG